MNNITIEFCKEDRERIDGVIGAITLLTSVLGSALPDAEREKIITEATKDCIKPQVAETNSTAEDAPTVAPIIEEPTVETPAPVAEPTPAVKPVSLAEFQKAVTLAVSKGAEAKAAVKSIINKYATSVSAVPEDKRAEIVAELANI